ncbi:MAG: TetR/AcrR family transcriptional regulator [Jatrophihabitans sp.]
MTTVQEPITDGPNRRRRGEALESAICRAAVDELIQSGYASFTIDAVASRARTGKASIYRRWPSKDELLADAICRSMPKPAGTSLASDLPDSVGTRDALVMMIEAMTLGVDKKAEDSLRYMMAEVARDEELAASLNDLVLCPREEGLADLLRRGIRLGDVRPDAPIDLICELMPGLMMKRILLRTSPVMDREGGIELVDQILMPIVTPAQSRAARRTT